MQHVTLINYEPPPQREQGTLPMLSNLVALQSWPYYCHFTSEFIYAENLLYLSKYVLSVKYYS